MLRALDLFCGLGGWSDGLSLEGFDVLGVEIEPKIAALYKHPVIIQDVRTLDGHRFKGYDLIVGSPPCRDFSRPASGFGHKWRDPANPERVLELVSAFLNFVEDASPTYWLMENVPGLMKYIDLEPSAIVNMSGFAMRRALWGRFPPFLVPRDYRLKRKNYVTGKYRKWERARIPLPTARALGRAVSTAVASRRSSGGPSC